MMCPHPSARRLRSIAFRLVGGAVLGSLLFAALASAATPNFKGSSADGTVVLFETDEQLIAGDTDTKRDVYERSYDTGVHAYVTREVSLGPTGGNDAYEAHFEAVSDDGRRIFFSTEERLAEEDADRGMDIYMRDLDLGETTLVSSGEAGCAPDCGNGVFGTTFAAADRAGTEVLFTTREALSSPDTDSSSDLYVRDLEDGETRLVSVGDDQCLPGCGNGNFDVSPRGISADGSRAYFTTAERLADADDDETLDIYARELEGGATSLVSAGECAECGNGESVPIFDGSSEDGGRVFFSSDEKLVDADEDGSTDVYARDLPSGPAILVSGGSGDVTASYAAASADGSKALFTTAEGLDPGDADEANDIYEWDGGSLELVTPAACSSACGANFEAVSEDASEVLFSTSEKLSPLDTDARDDIYRQRVGGGEPVLASRGDTGCPSCWNTLADARFNRAAADLSRVVFTTSEGLLPEDRDEEDDIYVRDVGGESSSLITTSPSYCPLKKGNCGATFVGASADGLHVFFRTVERFTLEDGDNDADVYERFLGAGPGDEVTRLVSTGNSPDLELGPAAPILTATDPESPNSSAEPKVIGEAEPGSAIKLYTSSDCSGEPVAAGTAAQLLEPGLSASVALGSVTFFRATAEAEGFVSACSAPISYRQRSEGPGSPGGGEEGGGGGAGGGGGISWIVGTTPKAGGDSRPAGPLYVTPQTRITFAPASKTRSRNPVFRFTDATGQPGTRFRCKLDRKPWKRCSSPLRLKRLGRGRHRLKIMATNAAGASDAAVAKRAFRVVPR